MSRQTIHKTHPKGKESKRMVQDKHDRLRTEKGGRFVKIITDEAIIASIKNGNTISREIAEDLNVHQINIQKHMKDMYARGLIDRRKIGATYVYHVIE